MEQVRRHPHLERKKTKSNTTKGTNHHVENTITNSTKKRRKQRGKSVKPKQVPEGRKNKYQTKQNTRGGREKKSGRTNFKCVAVCCGVLQCGAM